MPNEEDNKKRAEAADKSIGTDVVIRKRTVTRDQARRKNVPITLGTCKDRG